MAETVKKTVKRIKVDLDKCNGCRSCEIACASFHANPRYSNFNPARARIRMHINEVHDEWIAIRSTDYTKAECDGRRSYTIQGREFHDCSFCGTICPSRDIFYEPDSGLPLKCDMCENDPPMDEPMCVQICSRDALTYCEEEIEVPLSEQKLPGDDMEIGLQQLVDKYGFDKLIDSVARLAQKS
jgi:Fe-S-cluster-containing dehydrogenase component